jgi:hypothetical protein
VLHALVRSSLVLTGLLLLAVGIGNVVAGARKTADYEELMQATERIAPLDSAALFPVASERDERHALATAKRDFYRLLVNAGQLLAAIGCVLVVVGTVRVSLRPPPLGTNSTSAN